MLLLKVEEKSSTSFSFSLSPGFLVSHREQFSPFLYGKFQNKEQNTFIFLFLRVFSVLLHLATATLYGFYTLT
jgi:hypothetical protein